VRTVPTASLLPTRTVVVAAVAATGAGAAGAAGLDEEVVLSVRLAFDGDAVGWGWAALLVVTVSGSETAAGTGGIDAVDEPDDALAALDPFSITVGI
jgi:hypothetical protein